MARAKATAPTINPHRGEATWGKYKLCLTLNALVEIEEGIGVSLALMGTALANPSMKQLRLILGALVRGGGAMVKDVDQEFNVPIERPPTDEEIGREILDIPQASKAIEQAFIAAGVFSPGKEGAAPGPQL